MEIINEKLIRQKEFIKNNQYLDVSKRIELLNKLKNNIKLLEKEVILALKQDLNKCEEESYMTEIGIVYKAISYTLKHIKKHCKIKKVKTPLSNFKAKSFIYPSPYGQVLIISPWNYPFLLAIEPLIAAFATGNTIVLKPSEFSTNTSNVVEKLIKMTFNEENVLVIQGDAEVSSKLLDYDFDYIFFTGSTKVGQIVLQKAAKHFTPVTLELGGKSPCVVDETANLDLAARRIVFGKLLNAGQTCIAPDYIYCHKLIKDKLIEKIKNEIKAQYGNDILNNQNYPKIINKRRFDCLINYIESEKVLFGGKYDEEKLLIEPTILDSSFADEVMKDEIFGPIFPIITYSSIDEVIENVNKGGKPLAFYIFSNSKENQGKLLKECDFGGGCINDTIMHICSDNLPFGGVKQSGMGAYHGDASLKTFTHYKSIIKKSNSLDVKLRYQPFSKIKYSIIRRFLK